MRLAGPETTVVGGTAVRGYLEVQIGSNPTWGTVCDQGFNSEAADVACRSMGFASGWSWEPPEYDGSGWPLPRPNLKPDRKEPFIHQTICGGTEASFNACSLKRTGECTFQDAVIVECCEQSQGAVRTTWYGGAFLWLDCKQAPHVRWSRSAGFSPERKKELCHAVPWHGKCHVLRFAAACMPGYAMPTPLAAPAAPQYIYLSLVATQPPCACSVLSPWPAQTPIATLPWRQVPTSLSAKVVLPP